MVDFLNGVEVQEIQAAPPPLKAVGSSTIGLAGFISEDMNKDIKAGLHLVVNEKDAAVFGTTNPVAQALRAIFLQSGAKIIVSLVEPVKSKEDLDVAKSQTALIGTAGDEFTGIKAFLNASTKFGVKPKLLISDLTHNKPVAEALLQVAEKLRGFAIIDAPNTFTDAINYATKQIVNSRCCVVTPRVISNGVETALSGFIAGIAVQSDREQGVQESFGNRKIKGIDALTYPIDFNFGDKDCRANILNQNHIITVVNEQGMRSWGNHTTSDNETWRFVGVRRIADMISDSIVQGHLWAVAKNLKKTYISAVEDSVNNFLRDLKSQDVIKGGVCKFNGELTTPTIEQQGISFYDVNFATYYTNEHIIFRAKLVNGEIEES